MVAARATRFWEHRRAHHLLTGKVFCGVCGGPMAAVGLDYLGCGHARRQGTCTNRRSVRRHVLDDLIVDALKHHLMAPELVEEFITAYHEETNRQRRSIEAERSGRVRELGDVERRLTALIDAISDGLRAPALQGKLDELEGRKAEITRDLGAPAPTSVRLLPNLGELYRSKVADLKSAVADPETRTEALEILRGLVERVVLHPVDGGLEVELVGEIANMVSLGAAAQSKTAAPGGAAVPALYRTSVKVVAGTRNHRQLTLEAWV